MTENAGTTPETPEAQEPAAELPATGTVVVPDEVTTLRSRNAGLDAKVSALQLAEKAAKAEAAEAKAALAAYEQGKVGSEAALASQLQAKEAELEKVRKDAQLARIEAKYPETFAVLGEAAANLSADKLAEAEARFKGVAAEVETTQRPIGNNPSRTQGGASTAQTNPGEETLEQMRKRVFSMPLPG